MFRPKLLFLVSGFLLLATTAALAQYPVIHEADVKSRMLGKHKAMVIDSRNAEEYQAGHIPGAVNIPAERVKDEAFRLPKQKSAPLIFYCRGAG